jgi:hypothetical protein
MHKQILSRAMRASGLLIGRTMDVPQLISYCGYCGRGCVQRTTARRKREEGEVQLTFNGE